MPRMIFVNLPVADLARSIAFYEGLGAVRDNRFADDTAQCMTFSDSIHVMVLTHAKFAMFTSRTIIDATANTEVLLALSQDDRAAVESVFASGIAAGGSEAAPMQDHGFMVQRSIADPDGHVWELMWMDMAAFAEMTAGTQAEVDA